MLVGTPGFQQPMIRDIGNDSSHTWFSSGNDQILVGTPGFL